MNCLFALSYFVLLVHFFSVPLCSKLCMPLSAGQGSLLVCFMTCFCEVKTQDASDSHCDTNTNCSWWFNEWLLTPGLYPCFAHWGCWGACSFLEPVLHKRWNALTNRWCVIIWAQLYRQTKLAAHQIWHETLFGGRTDAYTDRLMYYCCVLNVSLRGNIAYGSEGRPKWKGFCVFLFLFQLLSFLSLLIMLCHVYFFALNLQIFDQGNLLCR